MSHHILVWMQCKSQLRLENDCDVVKGWKWLTLIRFNYSTIKCQSQLIGQWILFMFWTHSEIPPCHQNTLSVWHTDIRHSSRWFNGIEFFFLLLKTGAPNWSNSSSGTIVAFGVTLSAISKCIRTSQIDIDDLLNPLLLDSSVTSGNLPPLGFYHSVIFSAILL